MTLFLYTALRQHELVALDVADVAISARKGLLIVRSGKGDVYREIPLNPSCRKALEHWLKERCAADGCPRGRSTWSCAVSQLERSCSCRRTSSGTRA